jgi:hypothetical protein
MICSSVVPGVNTPETPTEDDDVGCPLRSEGADDGGKQSVVCAAHDGQAHAIDVFLHGGVRDHLRRLMKACVDHLEPRVAEGARHDLRPSVMPIEARLGDEDADFALGHRDRDL